MNSETRTDTSTRSGHVPDELFESDQSRREFLRTASASAVLAVLGLSIAGCGDENPVGADDPDDDNDDDDNGDGDSGITIDGNEITLDLTKEDTEDLADEGGFLVISEADTMAVNVDGETIRAFTNICTHEQCSITQFDGSTFNCGCHGSQFDTSGEVVQGPAGQSLTEYDVEWSDDTVTITK